MTIQVLLTLITVAVMAVLLLSGKFSFGLITISCAAFLGVVGIIGPADVFSGFANPTVILTASMFGLTAALQKTNLPYKAQGLLGAFKGKSNFVLVLAIFAVYMIMNLVMPGIVCIVLIANFLLLMPEDSKVKPHRIILPILMLMSTWEMSVPIGMGAAVDFQTNMLMEGLVTDPSKLFVLGDTFHIRLILTGIALVYTLIIWRFMPGENLGLGDTNITAPQESTLAPWRQYLIYALFVINIIVMIFNSAFGNLMWILPAFSLCVIGLSGAMSPRELVTSCANNAVWMVVGVSAVSTAMTKSGAADALGQVMLPLISWTENSFLILMMVSLLTAVCTMFVSNTGTKAVLIPLVTTIALKAGMDPRSLAICVTVCSYFDYILPSGSANSAFVYGYAKYNALKMLKMLKYTIPLFLISIAATAVIASILFPPFG